MQMTLSDFCDLANTYGYEKIPFFFLIDFELQNPFICRLEQTESYGIKYLIRGNGHTKIQTSGGVKDFQIKTSAISLKQYEKAFNLVSANLKKGNSYLLNLTFPTRLDSDIELEQIYYKADAAYKLYYQDKFVLYSPECFIRTGNDMIFSYPMKGTIDAQIPDADKIILADKKETWEHNTIVDLIRNDLAMVSNNITVNRFRYIDRIKTDRNELLQVSSEIRGELEPNWRSQIGSMLVTMLPAGSISGAPKKKTVEIIRKAEKQDRGYYTGIFGVFDGSDIDSAVNIRYIEKIGDKLQYRSGGGITAMSNMQSEYQELQDKVYVPVN
jgi:para-aminobenzoate synthetase component 1